MTRLHLLLFKHWQYMSSSIALNGPVPTYLPILIFLSDCSRKQTHKHLVRQRTLNKGTIHLKEPIFSQYLTSIPPESIRKPPVS